MKARYTILLASMAILPFLAHAQEKAKYPKVNVAAAYEVDPAWPARPKDMPWADMPGIAVDGKDNVYVFTRAVPPVQVYDAGGKFLRAWGDEKLKGAHHIKIDRAGNIWLAVYAAHVVQKYTPEGKLLLSLGTQGEAGRDDKHLDKPTDMVSASNGDIYVADGYGNARIVHYDKNGKFIRTWGELGHKPGQFSIPHAIAIDSKDRLYVADRNNVRIQIFDAKGKFLEEWKDVVTPWGFHMTKDDELWVCGSSPMQWRKTDEALGCPPKDQVFMKFATAGRLLQLWTVPKGSDGLEQPGELNWVHCLALDSKGNIYAGDIKGKKAQKFVRKEP